MILKILLINHPFTAEVALAFHVPAFQRNHSKRLAPFSLERTRVQLTPAPTLLRRDPLTRPSFSTLVPRYILLISSHSMSLSLPHACSISFVLFSRCQPNSNSPNRL